MVYLASTNRCIDDRLSLTSLFCGIRERVKSLHKQKWIRKFPPLATIGEDTYKRIKNHGQVGDLPV
jgi:hypothetical protein